MLDDRGGWLLKFGHDTRRRIEIEKVRVRELLALQHRETLTCAAPFIERGALVGILAVPEIANLPKIHRHRSRQQIRRATAEPGGTSRDRLERGGDRGVVAAGMFERLARKT